MTSEQSPDIGQAASGPPTLAQAILATQKEIKQPKKDATNPHFNRKYATLLSVAEAIVPVANKHGIAIMQDVGNGVPGHLTITTTLLHESGESRTFGPLPIPLEKVTPQGAGAGISYGRRYHLAAIFCQASEDDDANSIEPAAAPARPVLVPQEVQAAAATLGAEIVQVTPTGTGNKVAYGTVTEVKTRQTPAGTAWDVTVDGVTASTLKTEFGSLAVQAQADARDDVRMIYKEKPGKGRVFLNIVELTSGESPF